MDTTEIAKRLYTAYCIGVGGIAYNGDKLPGADEFFNDETKAKQVNAWKAAADEIMPEIEDANRWQRLDDAFVALNERLDEEGNDEGLPEIGQLLQNHLRGLN